MSYYGYIPKRISVDDVDAVEGIKCGGTLTHTGATTIAGNLTTAGLSVTKATTVTGNVLLNGGVSLNNTSYYATGYLIDSGFSPVTQATNINTPVAVLGSTGLITTQTATTGVDASDVFRVDNTYATAGNSTVVFASLQSYSGTIGTNGYPHVNAENIQNGSFDIRITNLHQSNALNGTLVINVWVFGFDPS